MKKNLHGKGIEELNALVDKSKTAISEVSRNFLNITLNMM